MAVGIVLLATAGFTLLSNAGAASMPSSSSRSRQGSSAPTRSSSYTATGVQTADARTSHAIDANLHPAVLRTQRLHPQGDLGVSYIGDPPDTGEAISRAELFAMMLRKEVNPATRHATPRQKKQRRIVPSVKETSQRRGGPAPRLSYVKTVSYIPFPFYGFGYGLHHYSPWTYYSPLGR